MIKIKDESIEIEGSVEEVTKEFTLIAIHLIELFEKKSGKLFAPNEILSAGVMLLGKEDGENDRQHKNKRHPADLSGKF